MFGAHHRGFDWKEIAEVLHITRAMARATFWQEIKRSRSKSVEARLLRLSSRTRVIRMLP